MSKYIDESGNRYGRLLVTEEAGRGNKGSVLWKCLCDCGKETIVYGYSLRSGKTKSCGCLHQDKMREMRQLPEGQAVFNDIYLSYKIGAGQRELSWGLTKEDFSFITKMNCHYCGEPPAQTRTKPRCNGGYTYNGLDRVDNGEGYVINNVVPCCGKCNKMKSILTRREFLDQVSKIASYRNDR